MADWLCNSSCLCLCCLAPQTGVCPAFLSSQQSVAPILLSGLKGFRSVLNCISLSQYSQLISQGFLSRLLRILSWRARRENCCSRDHQDVSVLKHGWETCWSVSDPAELEETFCSRLHTAAEMQECHGMAKSVSILLGSWVHLADPWVLNAVWWHQEHCLQIHCLYRQQRQSQRDWLLGSSLDVLHTYPVSLMRQSLHIFTKVKHKSSLG